jgi:C-terminal processing protease CtpA/Prc
MRRSGWRRFCLTGFLALTAWTLCATPAAADATDVARLAAMGRLWNAVKYFHPYLAYRDDIDWDAALIRAIPRVRAARTPEAYAEAIQSMLDALDDPATRVLPRIVTAPPSPPSPGARIAPASTLTADGLLIVTLGDHPDLSAMSALLATLETAGRDVPRARAILFDVRATVAASPSTRGLVPSFFRSTALDSRLSAASYSTPGQRTRMRNAFRTRDGSRVEAAAGARDLPIVFLVNDRSDIPGAALSLQAAGKATIVAEGAITDTALVQTFTLPLADGVEARVRASELVFDDGGRGVEADETIPVSQVAGEANPAYARAVVIARGGLAGTSRGLANAAPPASRLRPSPSPSSSSSSSPNPRPRPNPRLRASAPAHGVALADKTYADMQDPPVEYRLLAAFRLWGIIDAYFPYKALMDEPWDGVLDAFVPRMEQASTPLEYHLAIAEMVARIQDSHGVVQSPVLGAYFGTTAPPIRARVIEGVPVVGGFRDEALARAAGVDIGDVILTVDGEEAQARMARYAKYIAASTPQARLRDAVDRRSNPAALGGFLYGAPDSVLRMTVRKRGGETREIALTRTAAYPQAQQPWRTGDMLKLLPGNIGYADLDRVTEADVPTLFERFAGTKAIIFDLRGYPKAPQVRIAERLAARPWTTVARFEEPLIDVPPGRSSVGSDRGIPAVTLSEQGFAPAGPAPYAGRTVLLIDERAQSAAEHLGLFLKAANGTTFIGSPTTGANGNVNTFALPGGIRFSFSMLAVQWPDGRQLQRVGLLPDVEVRPTIKGLQEGRDELLDAAIAYINRS